MDPGSGSDRNSADKWSLFGPRPLQKSDPGKVASERPSRLPATVWAGVYTTVELQPRPKLSGNLLFSLAGFTIQAYKGAPKPSPMELMRAQATRAGEEPATFKPPKMDVPMVEGKKQPLRTHNLKPRDLNVLTPTGF